MARQIKGTELTAQDQKHVLAAYTHRYTRQHKPKWANKPWKDGKPYSVQFASDREWLENTLFWVRADGKLDRRYNDCQSNPTWPDGKD